jgi:hypothetical protein
MAEGLEEVTVFTVATSSEAQVVFIIYLLPPHNQISQTLNQPFHLV